MVLSWLERLPDDFTVFVELEGSDFQVDFLVFKRDGIFDVEAKDWQLREARLDAPWVLAGGVEWDDPFLQVLDQCSKVKEYILLQRNEVFDLERGNAFNEHRSKLQVFPVVAVSRPVVGNSSIFVHPYRKVFLDGKSLRSHLGRFEWCHGGAKLLWLERREIEKLAALFHLKEVNPRTVLPVNQASTVAVKTRPPVPAAPPKAVVVSPIPRPSRSDLNPYEYTYVVTGSEFYGRQKELLKISRCLQAVPPRPVMIVGLQRTGKSSLARESIRRFTGDTTKYIKIEFDFRRLGTGEALRLDQDLTLDFISQIAGEMSQPESDRVHERYQQLSSGKNIGEQRRLFRQLVIWNKDKGRHTILFLDECQEVKEFLGEARYKSFFDFLDALCRERELGLRVVLACRPAFFDLEPVRKINLGRIFEVINLGPLEEKPSIALIQRGSTHLRFSETAVKRIVSITGRHPYWIQALCHQIFENAVFSGNTQVSDVDVNSVFAGMVHDPGCRPRFYLLFQDIEAEPLSLKLLAEVANLASREGVPVALSVLSKEWQDIQQLRNALKPLVANQILTIANVPSNPAVLFQVEALRAWMRPNLITI